MCVHIIFCVCVCMCVCVYMMLRSAECPKDDNTTLEKQCTITWQSLNMTARHVIYHMLNS